MSMESYIRQARKTLEEEYPQEAKALNQSHNRRIEDLEFRMAELQGARAKLQAELEWNKIAATAEINRLRHELELIAKANPKAWEPDVRGQFREWAQNRANYCLDRLPLWPTNSKDQ